MWFLPDLGPLERHPQPVKIDEKDRQILNIIGQNARMPLSAIAKRVKVSRDKVDYRLRGLRSKKVIFHAQTFIDVAKFGYQSYHIFFRLKNPLPETGIIAHISALPYVRAVLKYNGRYDLDVSVIAHDVYEFDRQLTDIAGILGTHLQSYDILVNSAAYRTAAFPNSFLKQPLPIEPAFEPYTCDEKDMRILKTIRTNAEKPLLKIGQETEMSADTVSYRLKKMHAAGIIRAYQPVISYGAMGYTVYTMLLHVRPLDAKREATLRTFLTTYPHILWAVKTVGKYNLLLYVCVPAMKAERELYETISRLRSLFAEQITEYELLLPIIEYKYTCAPDILFSRPKEVTR